MTDLKPLEQVFGTASKIDSRALQALLRDPEANVREQRFIVAGASIIPSKPKQTISTPEDLVAQAKDVKSEFVKLVKNANGKVGGKLVMADDKLLGRIETKARDDYQGDVSRVLDPLRCTINIKSIEQYHKAVRFFSPENNSAIVRFENSFARPDDDGGLRRMMINYRLSNGLVGEIQVRHSGMEQAYKQTEGLYRKVRSIRADLKDTSKARDNETLIATQHRLDTMISERVRIHAEAAEKCGMDKVVLQREFMLINDFPVVKNFDPSTGEFETLIPDAATGRFIRDNRFLHLQDFSSVRIDKALSREAFIARCIAIAEPERRLLVRVPEPTPA